MKKFAAIMTVLLLTLTAVTGCGKTDGGTVSTDGSTSMEKVIGALGESFEESNSGVTFTYNPTGSGSGITAVAGNPAAIGYASLASVKETVQSFRGQHRNSLIMLLHLRQMRSYPLQVLYRCIK